jgi:hypothetical protein
VKRIAGLAVAIAVGASLVIATAVAGADSFTPIVMNVSIAPVARLHKPLRVKVVVTADAGVLDTATAPLRIRVKLASECGGEFSGMPGVVLVDKRLTPQPTYGQPYSGSASGSGKPIAYGMQTVCVFLEEEGDDRQFATDTADQVNVSRTCTVAADRYDADQRVLARARRRRRGVSRAQRNVSTAHRTARRACGNGVPL